MTLTLEAIPAKLPISKLSETIEAHVLPLIRLLPDKRLGAVVQHIYEDWRLRSRIEHGYRFDCDCLCFDTVFCRSTPFPLP